MIRERYLDEMRNDGAPDVVQLWSRTPVARKVHICACCGEPIPVGARYDSTGAVVDGVFEARKSHRFAWNYPSGCPTIGVKDREELERDNPPYPGFPMERSARG